MSNDQRDPATKRTTKKNAKPGKRAASAKTPVQDAHRPGTENSGAPDVEQQKGVAERLSARVAYPRNKAAEYGAASATPPRGDTAEADDPIAGASTITESTDSEKLGSGSPRLGTNPAADGLDRVRVDSSAQGLTTNQGVPVADNQSSLKAGLRGPALLEDFILREKITHFDHERIPERVVHARGSAAHGYFECYEPLDDICAASLFAEAGKITPVFVRFSTVAGERGSKDTARDVRGFAVKFYTDEGNWDLVGNNMPVFFIQDAIKFPDLVHAVKPEPHHGMPQAASAHDTFWDFVSLMPESTHMLMWLMSDRAIPRSYRMMQGFGVHTFRFVNAEGEARFVKFHWTPLAGTHALTWDEAVKISGADPDFHRRDLWEAIEAGAGPEYELAVQVFSEEEAEAFSFDVLDATKLVPEELVPLRAIGRMVLNRNPDNFFAETEQVAFCTAHIVPGIDFSNDPLLAGRIHSYVDTQISRLGGPNFHEIPINASLVPVHNNQRDGMHRQAIPRGRVAYEPNSLAGGCPFQQGAAGFRSFPEPIAASKLRGKSEKFAEHYLQARLFFDSQSDIERAHIRAAFRFELTKVQTVAVRRRMVAGLRHVSEQLAAELAADLGLELPEALPLATSEIFEPEVTVSPPLSMLNYPGDGNIAARRIAILIVDGVDAAPLLALRDALTAAGAAVNLVGSDLGVVSGLHGDQGLACDTTLEATPAVLYDAVVIPDGERAAQALAALDAALEFARDSYRHCKPLLVLGAGRQILDELGVNSEPEQEVGVIVAEGSDMNRLATRFIEAIAHHRYFAREMRDPAAR